MKLTRIERLMLWNQYEILKASREGDNEYYEMCQSVLANGFESEYGSLFNHIYGEELSISDCQFVTDTLNMFDALSRVGENGGEKLDATASKFGGFDGNNEAYLLSYAQFLVKQKHQWDYLGIAYFDSHVPMRKIYERMLIAFNRIPTEQQFHLTLSQGNEILAAREYSRS